MRRGTKPLLTLWRRMFGRYTIDDSRPIAQEAHYSFFLPTENQLLALQPRDLAKLIFRSHPAGWEWGVERMWVTITATDGDTMTGTLENIPADVPQLN